MMIYYFHIEAYNHLDHHWGRDTCKNGEFKMKKIIFGLSCIAAGSLFAETPNLTEVLTTLEQNLTEFTQKIDEKDHKTELLVRTEEDKLIRFFSPYPFAKGTELNSRISAALLSKGKHEMAEEVFPELGLKCKNVSIQLSKDHKWAISYAESCEKNG